MPSYVNGRRTDHAVLVRYMLLDFEAQHVNNGAEMDDARAEMVERFGPEAEENLASWFTGIHAAPDEIVLSAACDFEMMRAVMAGAAI